VHAVSQWKWPDIPGLHDFKGTLYHSARFGDGFDFTGKTVGVVGSGSSAIQIVPTLQPKVEKLVSFIRCVLVAFCHRDDHSGGLLLIVLFFLFFRSPMWIAPSQGFVDPKEEGPTNFLYTEEEKKNFRQNPQEFFKYRKIMEHNLNHVYDVMLLDSPVQKETRVVSLRQDWRFECDAETTI
jgi:hypothetical protein